MSKDNHTETDPVIEMIDHVIHRRKFEDTVAEFLAKTDNSDEAMAEARRPTAPNASAKALGIYVRGLMESISGLVSDIPPLISGFDSAFAMRNAPADMRSPPDKKLEELAAQRWYLADLSEPDTSKIVVKLQLEKRDESRADPIVTVFLDGQECEATTKRNEGGKFLFLTINGTGAQSYELVTNDLDNYVLMLGTEVVSE